MDDSPESPSLVDEIAKHVEAHSSDPPLTVDQIHEFIVTAQPRRHGPHFDALVEAIDWELRAQLATGRIGRIDATPEQTHDLAALIADEVDWRFRLDPRVPPGED